jgi:hypothetical protein
MNAREACPQCGSIQYKKNGHIHTGKQNHRCKMCGRAFVLLPENHVITDEQRTLIERLLLERISLRGICRAGGVGLQWLLQFMVERFQAVPEHLYVEPPRGTPAVTLQRLETELDGCTDNCSSTAAKQAPLKSMSYRILTPIGRQIPCREIFSPSTRSTNVRSSTALLHEDSSEQAVPLSDPSYAARR